MAKIEVRMIRARLMEALERLEDWRVETPYHLVRGDGLWVKRVKTEHGEPHFEVGSNDHGVAQATIPMDDELTEVWREACKVDIGTPRERRPALELLGVPEF